MREFMYYSGCAPTRGNFGNDLMKAGRLDIALNSILGAFFISNRMREDVKLHLVFAGPPDPVKHLELEPHKSEEVTLSKKDLLWIIKKLLHKYKEGKKNTPMEGYSVEKKPFADIIGDLTKEGKTIYFLDEGGEDIRDVKLTGNEVFVIGDHEGLPRKEVRRMYRKNKEQIKYVSVGKPQYLASQVFAIVQNEMDRQFDFH